MLCDGVYGPGTPGPQTPTTPTQAQQAQSTAAQASRSPRCAYGVPSAPWPKAPGLTGRPVLSIQSYWEKMAEIKSLRHLRALGTEGAFGHPKPSAVQSLRPQGSLRLTAQSSKIPFGDKQPPHLMRRRV
ncbi:unnamed protein product [Cuscuta epithymum]|uniref:Uncharacterized protein n=1 Tax=Cuscuta epithymum TaxID=186058 RepID=A0AAV0FGJ1_9ASTE|nr:unnamed protein product [Cuscuta epithymum]